MKYLEIPIESITTTPELMRSRSSKVFEEHLSASIDTIGLSEPLKVARESNSRFVVIDGNLRLAAIRRIRQRKPESYQFVPAYVMDWAKRYEIRFQSDIYQDLLPSQMATFVEHLHKAERLPKGEIARYIGVSPATLRNYTGVWRLLQREGSFRQIVELMDLGVIPASNPFAWLRLTEGGLQQALLAGFTGGIPAEQWLSETTEAARRGQVSRFHTTYVETVTGSLPPHCYRVGEKHRSMKRDLGLRKQPQGSKQDSGSHQSAQGLELALERLDLVEQGSSDPLLRSAAQALRRSLR